MQVCVCVCVEKSLSPPSHDVLDRGQSLPTGKGFLQLEHVPVIALCPIVGKEKEFQPERDRDPPPRSSIFPLTSGPEAFCPLFACCFCMLRPVLQLAPA